MGSGFKIVWTEHAISELKETIEYLETNWTERELRNFSAKLDHTIKLISKAPELFSSSVENLGFGKMLLKNIIIYIIGSTIKMLKSFHCSPIDKIRIRKNYDQL